LVRDGRGGVAIEFAFVIPIAILLTIGAVEVACAVSVQASINQAVKDTVRFASVRGSCEWRGCNRGRDLAVELADLTTGSTSANVNWDSYHSPGSVVTVDVQTTFTPAILLFGPSSYSSRRRHR
jgi:hypothetical protein